MTFWAHSKKDALLVGLSVLQMLGFAAAWSLYLRGEDAATWVATGLLVFLTCTNYQCVAHNFLHLPFFGPRWMNRAFAVWNTLLLGVPQTLYKYHHLNHHRFNSDYQNDKGETGDLSSIYRYSRQPRRPESLVRYALLSPIRSNPAPLYASAAAHGEHRQVMAEAAALGAAMLALALLAPRFALLVYLPVWYLGQVAAYAENYVEHFGAHPGNRRTDSVSCYAGWYNWIWFNNGYHQEHHWRPQVHWTCVPKLRGELHGVEHRRVVPYAHWFNWPILRATRSTPDA